MNNTKLFSEIEDDMKALSEEQQKMLRGIDSRTAEGTRLLNECTANYSHEDTPAKFKKSLEITRQNYEDLKKILGDEKIPEHIQNRLRKIQEKFLKSEFQLKEAERITKNIKDKDELLDAIELTVREVGKLEKSSTQKSLMLMISVLFNIILVACYVLSDPCHHTEPHDAL